MKNNIPKIKEEILTNTNKHPSLLHKLSEFILSVVTAGVVMYYLFKTMFGGATSMKENTQNISEIKSNIDTVYALQELTFQHVMSIKDDQVNILDLLKQTNETVLQNSKEINSMKKVVNTKINTANKIIHENELKNKTETTPKNYNTLDSFFRARANRNK
jgi:hypothetical protein